MFVSCILSHILYPSVILGLQHFNRFHFWFERNSLQIFLFVLYFLWIHSVALRDSISGIHGMSLLLSLLSSLWEAGIDKNERRDERGRKENTVYSDMKLEGKREDPQREMRCIFMINFFHHNKSECLSRRRKYSREATLLFDHHGIWFCPFSSFISFLFKTSFYVLSMN